MNKVPVEGKNATATVVTGTTTTTTTPVIPWQYQVLTKTGAEIQESSTQTLLTETTVFPVVQSRPTEFIPDATTSTTTTAAPNSTEVLTMAGPNTALNPEQELYRPITTRIEATETTQKPITVATNPAVKSVMPAEPSAKTVESVYGALKPIDTITKPFVNKRREPDYQFKFQEVANEVRAPVTLPTFFTADIQKNAMNSYVQQWTLMPKETVDFREAGKGVNYSYPLLNVSKNEQFGYNSDLSLKAAQNVMEVSSATETSDEVVESKSKTGFKTSEETPTGIYAGPTEIPSKQTEIETKPTETPIATQAVTKYEEIVTSPTTTPQQIGQQISNGTGYQYPQHTAPEIQPTQLPYYAKDKFTPPSNNPTSFNISRLLSRLGTTARSSKPPSGPSTLATNLTVSDYLSLLEAKESQGENPYAISYYGGAEAGNTQQPETPENGNSINQYEYGTLSENKNETDVLSPCQVRNACSSNVTNYDMRLDTANAAVLKKFSGHSDTSIIAINDGGSKDANSRTEIINMDDESNKPPSGEVVIPTTQSTETTPHIIIEAPKPDEELLEDLEDKNREKGLEKPVKWPFNLNPIALPPGFVKVNQYTYPSVSIEKVRGEKSSSNKFITPEGEINEIPEVSKGQNIGPNERNFKENLKGESNSGTEGIKNTTRSDVVHELNPITQKLASTTKETMQSTKHIITTSTTGATRTIATTSVPIVIKTKSSNWNLSATAVPFINTEVKTKANAESISDESSKVTYKEKEEEKINNEYISTSSIVTATPIATTVLQSEEYEMLQNLKKIVPTNKQNSLTTTGNNEDLMKQTLNTKEEEKSREVSLADVRQQNLIENFNQYQDLSQNIMVENISSENQLSRDRNTSLQHVAAGAAFVSATPSGPESTQASTSGIILTESSTNEPKPKDFENLNVQGPSMAHPTGPTTLSEAKVEDFKNKDVEGPSLALPTKNPTRPTTYQYTIAPITANVKGQNEFMEQAPSTPVIQNPAAYQNTEAPTTSSIGGQNVSTEQNPLTPVIQNVTTYPIYQNPDKEDYPPISNPEQSLSVNTTFTTTTQLPLTKVASTDDQKVSTEQTLTTPVIQNVATYPIYQKPYEENYPANSNSELTLASNTTSTTTTQLTITSASTVFTETLSTTQPSSTTAFQNVATYQNKVAPTGTSTDGEKVFAEQTLTTPVIQNNTYSIYQNQYKEDYPPNPTPEQSFAGNTSSATTALLPETTTSSVSTEHLSTASETTSTTQIPIYYTATVSAEQQTPNTGTSTTLSQDKYKQEIVSTKSPRDIAEDTANHNSLNVYGFASYFDYLRDYYAKIQKLYMSRSATYENTENNTMTDHQKIISNTITSPPEATAKHITPQETFETSPKVFVNSEYNNNAMAVQQTGSISTSTDELNVYPVDTSTQSYPAYSDSNDMFQQNLLKNNSTLDSLTNQVYTTSSTTPTPLQVEQYSQQSNSHVSQNNNLIQEGEDLSTTTTSQQEVTSTQSDKALSTQATIVSEQFTDHSFNRISQNSNLIQQDGVQNQSQAQNAQNQPNDNQLQQGWPYRNQQNQMPVFTTQSTTPKVLSVPVFADNNTGAKQQEEGADLEEDGIFEHTDDEKFKIKPVTTAEPSSKPSTTSKRHIVTQVYQTQYAPNNGFAIPTNNPVISNKPATGNLLTMSVKPTQNPNINLTAVEKGDSIQIKISTKPPPANTPQIATLYPGNAATPYPNLQNNNQYPQQQQNEISTTPLTKTQPTPTNKVLVSMPNAIELPTNKPAISEEVIPDATTSTASPSNTTELLYGNTYPSTSTSTTIPVNENQQNQGNTQLKPTVAPKVFQKPTNETEFTPTMIQNVHQTNQLVTATVSNNLPIENVITNPCVPSCTHTDLYPEGYGGVMEPVASTETNVHQENGYSTALNVPLQLQQPYTGKPMNLYEESTTETTAGQAAQAIQNTTVSFQTQQPNSYSSFTLEVTSPVTQTSPSITTSVYLPSLVATTSQDYQLIQNETKISENAKLVTESMLGNNQAVQVIATSTEPVKPAVINNQQKIHENLISTTITSTTVTVPPVTQTISPVADASKIKSMNNQVAQLITTTTEPFETSAQPFGYLGTGIYSQTSETATTSTTSSGASNQSQEYAPNSTETTSIMPQAVTPVSAETYYTTGQSTTTTAEILPQQTSSTVFATLPYLATGQQDNPYQERQYQTTTTFNVPAETQNYSPINSQVNPITSPITTKTTTEIIKPIQTATTTTATNITSKMQPNTSSETYYPAGETVTSTELVVLSTSTTPSTIYGGGNGFASYEEYLADYYRKLQKNYNGIQNQVPIAPQQSPISTTNPLEQQATIQTSSTKENIGIQQTVNGNNTQEKVTNPTTAKVTTRSVESVTVTSKPVDSETATEKPTESSVTSQSPLQTEKESAQSSEIQTTTTSLSEDKSKSQFESQEITTSSSEIQPQSQQTTTLSAGRNSPTYKPTPLYQANDIWWTVNDVTNLKETGTTSTIASITSPTMKVTANQFIALTPEIKASDNTLSINGNNNNNVSNKEGSTQFLSQVAPEVTVTKYKPVAEGKSYMGFSSYQEYLADYYKKIHLLYAKNENESEQNNSTISETNPMDETSAGMIMNNIENNADISGSNAHTWTTYLATKAKIETSDKEKSVKTEPSFSSETQKITEVTTTSTPMETSTITPPPLTLRNKQTAEKAATIITTTSTATTEAQLRTGKLSTQGLQTETATTEITKIPQFTTKPALNRKVEEISTTVPTTATTTTATLATTTTTESAQSDIDIIASSSPEEKQIKSVTTVESSSRNKPPTSIPIVTMEIDILPKMNEYVTTKPTPSRSQLTTTTSKPPTTIPENTLEMIENIEIAPTVAATTSVARANNNKFPTEIPSTLSREKEQTYKPLVTNKGENLLEIIENIEKSEEPMTPTRSYKFTTAVPFELSLQNTEPFNFDYGSKIGNSTGKNGNISDTDLVVDYLPQLINALSTSPQDTNPVTEAVENINQLENNIEPVTDNSNPNQQELNENIKQNYGDFNPSIDVGKPESQLLDALKTAMSMEPTIKPSIVATTPSSPIVIPVDSLMTKRSTESNEEQAVSTTSSMFLKATTVYNKYSFDEINDMETDNKDVAQKVSAPVLLEEKPYAVPSFPNANPMYETKETSSVVEGTVNSGNNPYHTSSQDENQHGITNRPTVPITGNKDTNKAKSSTTVHPDIATTPNAKATEYQNKAEKATNNIMESMFTQKAHIYDNRVNTNFPNTLKTEVVTTKYPFNDVYYDYVYNWKRYLQEIQNWVNRYMVPIEHRNISVHPDLHPTFAQSSSRYQSEYEEYLANLEQWEAKNRVNQLLGISTTPKSPSSVKFSTLRPYPRPIIESQIMQPNITDEYKYSTAAASNNATESKSDSRAEPSQKTQPSEEALKHVFFENTTPAVPKNINILTGQQNIQNPNYVVTNGQPLTEPNVNKVSREHLYNVVPRTPYAVYQPAVTYRATTRNEYIHSAETQKEISAVQTAQESTPTPVRTYSFETTTTKPDTNNQQSTTTESAETEKVNPNKEVTVTSANVNGGNSADNEITRTEMAKTDSPTSSTTTMPIATTQKGLYSTFASITINCQGL